MLLVIEWQTLDLGSLQLAPSRAPFGVDEVWRRIAFHQIVLASVEFTRRQLLVKAVWIDSMTVLVCS